MIPFYVVSALLALSLCFNGWLVSLVVKQMLRENGKLQAAAFARRSDPVTAAVYMTHDPDDERSPEQRLDDTPQAVGRDIKPLGL